MKIRAWIDYTKTESYKDYPEDFEGRRLGEMIHSEKIQEKRHVSPAGFYGDSDIDLDIMTFMVCSGIKDSVGKDIYEGDILEVDDGYHKFKCEVKFGEYRIEINDDVSVNNLGWFVCEVGDETSYGWKRPLVDLKDEHGESYKLEVIGNIHEGEK